MASSRTIVSVSLVGLGVIAVLAGGCSRVDTSWPPEGKAGVVASFPPLYSFAANVAGDDAAVRCFLTTAGPHDYYPSPHDAVKLHRASLFCINGLTLDDDFAGKMKKMAGNADLRLVDLGALIPEGQLRSVECEPCEHGEGDHAHHHHHGSHDPHVWMGIPEAVVMVQGLRDRLKEVDPAHAAGYDSRAAAYVARLEQLRAEGLEKLKDKKDRRLISFHDSLHYFARTFDLKIVDTIQPRCGHEADPAKIAKLVEVCRKEKIRLVAVEPQYAEGGSSARTLVEELHKKGFPEAELVVVDTLETAPPQELAGDRGLTFYERRMRANIEALAGQLR